MCRSMSYRNYEVFSVLKQESGALVLEWLKVRMTPEASMVSSQSRALRQIG